MLEFMWVTLCANWQGFKLTMTTKTLIGWFCIGKQHVLAYIPNYLIVSLHFFLQCYLFVTRTPYHQKSCDLEWWEACCEDFVLKSRVHVMGRRVPWTGQFLSTGVLSSYLWVLILETASFGAHTQFTFHK